MTRACSTYVDEQRCIEGFGGENLKKRALGRPTRRWKDNIKMDLRELEYWGHGLDRSGSG